MVIIPLGLVTKTKNIPIATILLSVATFYYSIVHFPVGEKAEEIYFHSQYREAFALRAKKHMVKTCDLTQARTYCQGIDQIPTKHFVLGEKITDYKKAKKKSAYLYDYIAEELTDQKLEISNLPLLRIKNLAKKELDDFVRNHQLLSKKNINWISSFRTLFLHGGWMHLIGNFLILILLAFPVEERMGSIFFAAIYLASGMFGSTLHAFFMQDSFYIVGASSAVSGIAGAFTVLFFKNYARLLVSFFFIFNKRVIIPVIFYTPFFMVASDLAGALDPVTNTAHLAHLGGFLAGVLMAHFFNKILPLPKGFTFPYELKYLEKTKNSLSQFDQVKVYTEWLFYAPLNMRAFRGLVDETKRSHKNTKVVNTIKRFKKIHFKELYRVNKNNKEFLTLLPISWLTAVYEGDDPVKLKKWAQEFDQSRDFVSAFKMNFLVMNDAGWKNSEAGLELFKSFKKATVVKGFEQSAQKLRENHSHFDRLLKEYNHHGNIESAS